MKTKFVLAAMAALVAAPTIMPAPVLAQTTHYDRNGRVYHGNDRNYRRRCRSGNGAVGTIAGGAGGAVIGSSLGGGTLGTVAGGVGGALLGRHLDKAHTRKKNGC